MADAKLFTLGIEEEFQLIDPETRDLRSHVQHLLDDEHTLADQLKPELHQSVIEVGTNICPDIKEARREVVAPAQQPGAAGAAQRPDHRGGRHPSVRPLEGPAHHGERALQGDRRRPAADRAGEPDLRPPRPRGHRGPRGGDPHHERRPLLPAAHLRAVDQLAVLAGAQHRASSRSAARSSTASRAPASRTTSRASRSTRTTSSC